MKFESRIPVVLALVLHTTLSCVTDDSVRSVRVTLPNQEQNLIKTSWPPIGCWFWTAEELQPGGYRRFLDLHQEYSPFGLLTTSLRDPGQLTDPGVHAQLKAASQYARHKGMGIVLDLDVRLARTAFRARYPDELQQIVLLREFPLGANGVAEVVVEPVEFGDHYTYRRPGYDAVASRLLRVYSYCQADGLAAAGTVVDITRRSHAEAGEDGLVVSVACGPEDAGRTACALVGVTHLTPAVFAPHLISFQHEILEMYADASLAGACKDEWGFPGRFDPSSSELWYSQFMSEAYSSRRPGRALLRDMLLMSIGEQGRARARKTAINHYMEMCRQRQGEIETAFYQGVKKVLGSAAMVGTHPTWYSCPNEREVYKNGLSWWVAKRDLAQTDEDTPFCVRTALAKKAGSPVWYNMIYRDSLAGYDRELWCSVLGGGRLNFHPLWPHPWEGLTTSLFGGELLRAAQRIQLLNYISTAAIDCPVAVVFGHPAALNWAGAEGFAKVGLDVCDALWEEGFYADLIPSSEIASGALEIGADGSVRYGQQRYAAVVFYQPQYERREIAEFFVEAARSGKTALYRVGEWTMDFEGRDVDGSAVLPTTMVAFDEAADCVRELVAQLKDQDIVPQPTCEMRERIFGESMMPPTSGRCRLLDGTVILAAGEHDVMGDRIERSILVDGKAVRFDAIGIAAVRLDRCGRVEAMAAGGLRAFHTDSLSFELPEPLDLALFRERGEWRGVVQGGGAVLPEVLTKITSNWIRVRVPARYRGE